MIPSVFMSRAFYSSTQQRQVGRVLPDLLRARGLLWDLISKEFRARYRNATIGVVWAVLQPLLMTLILAFVFGVVFQWRFEERGIGGDEPLAVFLLCGLVPWQFLATALAVGVGSLVGNRELVKKVGFAREVIPLSAVLSCIVNLAIGFLVLIGVRLLTGGPLGVGLIWVLPIFVVQLALIVGLSLLLSAMNVLFRDVFYMTEILIALGFYATPIFYPLQMVENSAAGLASKIGIPALSGDLTIRLYMLNPMAGLVTAYRQAFLGNQIPDADLLVWPVTCAVVALVLGVVAFRRIAPTMADHL
ncbi:MAG: ABC transporter permease [bacterium]|nr:ABC transporter permease [bacterium]